MESYLKLLDHILTNGQKCHNRTGIDTIAVSGYMFEHNMKDGFPLLTTKKMGYKTIFSELNFFIQGMNSKKWLQENKNHIWDEWCNPQKVPYAHDEATKAKMAAEDDLGLIYGVQWRNFDAYPDKGIKGTDQLKKLVDTMKTDPTSRRMIVSAWNPNQLDQMALPPCHVGYQVICYPETNTMDLIWCQRSVDTMLGLPYNIASYACLLHLLCLETGYTPGKLIGMLGNVHIYENHIDGAKLQMTRTPHKLPTIRTDNFTSIFNWKYTDTTIENYEHDDAIKLEIAV